MRKTIVKKPKKLLVKPGVKSSPSKPSKTGLSKSDPNYYSKIGTISAKKRQMTSAEFSAMARLSHKHRTEYHGGRRKKNAGDDAALAVLDRDLRRATDLSASH